MVSVFQINSLSVFVFLFLRDRILAASSLDTIKALIMFLIGKRVYLLARLHFGLQQSVCSSAIFSLRCCNSVSGLTSDSSYNSVYMPPFLNICVAWFVLFKGQLSSIPGGKWVTVRSVKSAYLFFMLLLHSGLTVVYSENMSFWDPFWVLSVHMHIQKLKKTRK